MARMRLRQRSPRGLDQRSQEERSLPDDWVQPRRSGRWTTIGNLDSPARGLVDPAGLVTIEGAGWSLDWWIGAEDRWHLPCREVAVRQSLISGSPVVETRLRVPSGDAVHRAYAARSADGSEAVVIEVENQSKIPFAVALAVRPHSQAHVGRIDAIELDGARLLVDGVVAVVLAKSPGRVALSDARSGDSAAVVFAGDAAPVGPASVSCDEGLAQGALLFPLAHTATLRVLLPLSGGAASIDPAVFPAAAQVASGWSTHAGGGTRIEVPDRRLRDAVVASTRHLLLGQGSAEVAAALDLMGFPAEAARLLTGDTLELARAAAPGATLHAVSRHWELTHDAAFARAVVDLVAALVARLGRTPSDDGAVGHQALAGAVELLAAAGERRAAEDVRTVAATPGVGATAAPELGALLTSASSTWTWASTATGHDLTANATLVTLVRAQLVTELVGGLALSPIVPDAWLGQGWELHGAPTSHGRLSYAIRWHGDRPAVLWELEPHPGAAPATLTAPALDPAWSTIEASGEALLAPVAIPDKGPRRGLTIPVSIEPMPRRQP